MLASHSYPQRIEQLLGDWALLAGHGETFSEDSRMNMLTQNLEQFAGQAQAKSCLCADGSPVEICERISAQPQAVAFTMEPLPVRTDEEPHLSCLCRLLGNIAPEGKMQLLRSRIGRYASGLSHLWLGTDFARPGVRIYCHFTPVTAGEIMGQLQSGNPIAIAQIEPEISVRRSIVEIQKHGALRMIGLNFDGIIGGAKLAFAHPLEVTSMERLAGACSIPFNPLQDYMRLLSPSQGGWRSTRCGLALTLNHAGYTQSLTVYHYAASYFLDDLKLRSFVLRIAEYFLWDTQVYRGVSRLLDREGERMRSLIGFTVSASGETSLRLYGQTGAFA